MLRPLLNVYHERLKVGRSKTQLGELERELNRPPRKGRQDVPRSRGTKALMALMGMPPPPRPRPATGGTA